MAPEECAEYIPSALADRLSGKARAELQLHDHPHISHSKLAESLVKGLTKEVRRRHEAIRDAM